MFKFLCRRLLPKTLSKEDKEIATILLKDIYKIKFISCFVVACIAVIPLTVLLAISLIYSKTLFYVSFLFFTPLYFSLALWLFKRFSEQVIKFIYAIIAKLYSKLYLVKGNALLKEDFNKIKEKDEALYKFIMDLKSKGFCYAISFHILQCLEKGEIKFIAIRNINFDNSANYYTMHVVYVKDGWCFDTYSQKQHPVEDLLKQLKAKEYKSFSFSDIEGKNYEDFRKEHYPELKKWCQKNDCYQEWIKE